MRALSPWLTQLNESNTLAVTRRAAAMREAGIDISPLAAGEPDFDTPPHIIDAMVTAARGGATRYPPVLGLPPLRNAVAALHTRRYGVTLGASRIAVTPGAKFALWAGFQALLSPGDEVLVPVPSWVSYGPQIELAQGRVVQVPCSPETGWRISADTIRRALTPRSVALVLCSPNNPTGVTLEPSVAAEIAQIALMHDLWLICDDLYAELVFTGGPFVSPLSGRDDLVDRTIIIDGLSKSHAMTGWRIGYMNAPTRVIDVVGRLLGQTLTGTTTFVQHAALAALTVPFDLGPMRAAYAQRGHHLTESLASMGFSTVHPDGGFCLLTDVRPWLSNGLTSEMLALQLLERGHVASVAGEAFGAPGFIRLSFACSDSELAVAVSRLASFFEEFAR
jgi:aspartate aminotransferase